MKINTFLKQNLITSIGILFSRITGFTRDIFFANVLGVGDLADAFFAAFKLPNIFRRILADGGLVTAFVPVFTKSVRYNKKAALILTGQIFSVLFLFISVFILFLSVTMPYFIKITNPGFIKNIDKLDVTIKCTRISIFFLFFTSISALFAGVLNSVGKFGYHAFSTVLFNIGLIFFGYFALKFNLEVRPIYLLCYALLFGGLIGTLFNWFGLKINNLTFLPQKIKFNIRVKRIMTGIFHSIASSGMINVFINMIFASFFTGVVSYIYYIDRIVNIPVSIIGYTLAGSTLRAISLSFANQDKKESDKTHDTGFAISIFLSIPSLFILLNYGDIILKFIYGHSKFTAQDFRNLQYIMEISAICLPFIILNRIFSSSFFAAGLSKIQFRISIFGILLDIILTLSLMKQYTLFAMSIAFSLTNIILFFITIIALKFYKIYNFFKVFNLSFIALNIIISILADKILTFLIVYFKLKHTHNLFKVFGFSFILLILSLIIFSIYTLYKKCSKDIQN